MPSHKEILERIKPPSIMVVVWRPHYQSTRRFNYERKRKYPEYMAYYNQYNHDERPDKDSLREQFANAEEYLTAKQHKGLKIILNIIIGIMLFALTVFDWRIGIGADISFIVGVLIGRL